MKEQEKLAQVYVSMFENLKNQEKVTIKFYENQYKFYLDQLMTHRQNEPLKIFKKKHNDWQSKLEILENGYNNAFDKFVYECNELENLAEMKNV